MSKNFKISMKQSKLEYRMYFFVMYNLSEIQKGIQAGHAVEQYALKYRNKYPEYDEYVKNHKTWIVLNGGVSNSGIVLNQTVKNKKKYVCTGRFNIDESLLGTMELHERYLLENKIPHAAFREPDLNNSLSAIAFLCDERVFDFKNYPNFISFCINFVSRNDGNSVFYGLTDEEIKDFFNANRNNTPYSDPGVQRLYNEWVGFVGGPQNAALKILIEGKKLA